ncbi:MAG: S53 family peptidase, partial [Thermoplasmata archaeon]|nr:S53 family peptidase [Thermoplasmata archaeon]
MPVLLCVALLGLPGVAMGGPGAATQQTSIGSIGVVSAHLTLPAALSASWSDRTGYDGGAFAAAAGAVPATEPNVSILVTLWPRDLSFFTPAAGAPPLNADQIRAKYAPSEWEYTSVVNYFESRGLTVTHAWSDDLSVTLSGSATAVGASFGTQLLDATWEGRPVRLPSTVPSLPPAIQSLVSSVSGLSSGFSDFTVPFTPASMADSHPARTTTLLWPSATHGIYGLDGLYNYSGSSHWATGIGIALVLWGEGYDPSDINSFFSSYYPAGFPAISYAGYPVDGAPPPSASAVNDPSNVTSEMTLDMEWAGSAAPGASISAVYAPDGPAKDGYSPSDVSLEDALNYAISRISGVRVVSMSFGTPDGSDASFQSAFTQLLADAQNRGITVLAASGDTGGAAKVGCQGGDVAEFPAASQYVVAVGGTAPVLSVDTFGSVTGLASEPAWNRSGGGFSSTVSAPVWQEVGSAAGPIERTGQRGLPDVAGPAADNVFYFDGQEAAGAGTSFASPFWGGIIAEMDAIRGSPLGFVTPRLYAVGADEANRTTALGLVDITEGSNCLGAAGPGWDTATGWGSPRADTLYQDLSGTFVNVSLSVSSTTVAPGESFTAAVLVTNATSFAPISGASVTFELASVNYPGPCGGSIASATGPTGINGGA